MKFQSMLIQFSLQNKRYFKNLSLPFLIRGGFFRAIKPKAADSTGKSLAEAHFSHILTFVTIFYQIEIKCEVYTLYIHKEQKSKG